MTNLPTHPSLKNESVQYHAALAITGAIKGSSCEKLYQKLRLEHLYQRRWARRLCLHYEVFSGKPSGIYDLLGSIRSSRRLLVRLILFLADLNTSRTPSFLISLLNRINWILTFPVSLLITYFVISINVY